MDSSFNICQVCKKSMSDPKILPCAHSFCLQCLETSTISKESSMCPTCQMDFETPQGGLKNLRKNDFISKLHELKQSLEICNSCDKIQAAKYCIDCSNSYCLSCLDCHKQFPATRNHQITEIDAKSRKLENKKFDYEVCDDHGETMTLFCSDCDVFICSLCMILAHKSHAMIHMSQYFVEIKKKLYDDINAKELILQDIECNYESSENFKNENERRANELKKEIGKRGEEMKKNIDSIVEELKKNVDEKLKEYNKEADDVLWKLENLNKNINAQIKTLKQQLNDLKCKRIVENSTLKDEFENIPKYEEYLDLTLSRDENEIKSIFGSIIDGRTETTYQFKVNISSMNQSDIFSPDFHVRQLPWCLEIDPYMIINYEDSEKYLGIYLYCKEDPTLKSWSCNAKFKFKLLTNKPDRTLDVYADGGANFLSGGDGYGKPKFITMDELLDPYNGYVKDESVTFEVYVKADEPKGV